MTISKGKQGTMTYSDEAGDYAEPNMLSPRDLVFRSDKLDHHQVHTFVNKV